MALENVVDMIDVVHPIMSTMLGVEKARAAIAKAKGES